MSTKEQRKLQRKHAYLKLYYPDWKFDRASSQKIVLILKFSAASVFLFQTIVDFVYSSGLT